MKRAFDRRGALAISASALGVELEVVEAAPVERRGSVAIISIVGPMIQRAEPGCPWDSYDAIKARALKAFASSARTVVLKIDSPGGDVAGCFELSRDLRELSAKSGKRLLAYVHGMGCSGGYALACAASQISTSSAGCVGSIGVAHMLVDTTIADRAMGLTFAVVTSGARKADGNSHVPITAATLAATQAAVDGLAAIFFDLVASSRGISALVVRRYEAGIFFGVAARAARLVDTVCTFDELLGSVTTGAAPAKTAREPAHPAPVALGKRLANLERSLAVHKANASAAAVASALASSPSSRRVAALEATLNRHVKGNL